MFLITDLHYACDEGTITAFLERENTLWAVSAICFITLVEGKKQQQLWHRVPAGISRKLSDE
jgi:hypothetical protein